MSPALFALQLGWSIWATIWIAAAWWSARTISRSGRAEERTHRLVTLAGLVALLIVTRPSGFLLSPLWHLAEPLQWAMVALMVAAIAFACWARLTLGSLWSVSVVRKEQHRLIEAGPYAIVRHPIYTGLIAAGFATAAVKATPLALTGLVLLTAGFAIKARLEERFLSAELGERDYAAYRSRVPMLVPFAPPHRHVDGGGAAG